MPWHHFFVLFFIFGNINFLETYSLWSFHFLDQDGCGLRVFGGLVSRRVDFFLTSKHITDKLNQHIVLLQFIFHVLLVFFDFKKEESLCQESCLYLEGCFVRLFVVSLEFFFYSLIIHENSNNAYHKLSFHDIYICSADLSNYHEV